MKCYLSGAITTVGVEEARKEFEKWENCMKDWGHDVVNPMKAVPYKEGRSWLGYMIRDVRHLMKCDTIIMLPNWKQSRGARIERRIAKMLGMWVIYE